MKPSIKVIGVLDDINSSFMRGSEAAPPLIRKAMYFDSYNLFSESGLDSHQNGIWEHLGDIEFSVEVAVENLKKIKNFIKDVLASDQKNCCVKRRTFGFVAHSRCPFGYIRCSRCSSFDAHPDLYDYLMDNKLSHAYPLLE